MQVLEKLHTTEYMETVYMAQRRNGGSGTIQASTGEGDGFLGRMAVLKDLSCFTQGTQCKS